MKPYYTDHHAKLWAALLSLRGEVGTLDRLSQSLDSARVDLNPHQVDAALFALRSPLSKGVILADEVGLGKTIEASLVISQRWAERRRRILLILPATLRKQWQQELLEKFSLPSVILETKSFNQSARNGSRNPFERLDVIVICSYNFAAAKKAEITAVSWDLVVVDEAHRLRNVYKTGNKTAAAIGDAIRHAPKLLVTATPLQNSLMELYGLASIADPNLFGDERSFRERYLRSNGLGEVTGTLRSRLQNLCTRTLRKQVLEYIRFTRREPLTQDFLPTDAEHELYEKVSSYLQREVLVALPASQRSLITLVLRKLLASSTRAIAGTLRSLIARLEELATEPLDAIDFEGLDELADEWDDSEEPPPAYDPGALKAELEELRGYAELAESIQHNAKGEALLSVLGIALDRAEELGAARKAVIFTESRRTQTYLFELLSRNGYADQIVLINGGNTDPHSRSIYEAWLARHQGSQVISGSRSADMKAALVEEFRDRAMLLIATESAAEGVNLQFCSLVVNYDLPWNPMRIEQRIGRCHRYGQHHDVVVVNFVNRRNAADQRVFQLLSEKFQLFEGLFGASDEVLGALESGVDIERRIADVYQRCRTADEIQAAFDALQAEFDERIQTRMETTRRTLLENFDEEVTARLRVHREQAMASLSERQQWLLALTRREAGQDARFEVSEPRFHYTGPLAPSGDYHLDWRKAEASDRFFYFPEHALAQKFIASASNRETPLAELVFDYSGHGSIISTLQPLVGRSGWMAVSRLAVTSFEREEVLLYAGGVDAPAKNPMDLGELLDEDTCRKFFLLHAQASRLNPAVRPPRALNDRQAALQREHERQIEERNAKFFDDEVRKLDLWADDLKLKLELQIKELDKQITEARRMSNDASTLTDKLAAQKHLKGLESHRKKLRQHLYEQQDAIDAQRDDLIGRIERQLNKTVTIDPLFTIRWVLR